MDFTGKKVLNKLIAIIAILAMTLSDFVLVGTSAISYAIDIARTTVDNVEFSVYFVDSNGSKINKVDQATDAENLKMYVDVSVKNEGYFDGEISLGNSNFKIVNKNLSEKYVSEIQTNKVTLKRIDAGKTAKVELEIEKNLPETMPVSLLNMNTEVNLAGKYTDSKKTQDISGKSNVEVDWKTSENTKAETTLDILTNKVFQIDGNSKRVVQLLISSKLTNNNYPVKNTKINIVASQGAESVTVEARNTSATNGNASFTNENYSYNQDEANLEIKISNENNNSESSSIKYMQNSADELIVTYIYPEEFETEGTKYLMNTTIVPYDNLEKTSQNETELNENKDGIVTLNIESIEKEIYKGKIYTGEDRNYESTTRININKTGLAKRIIANELPSTYDDNSANIVFNQTKISKAEFDKLFGAEGYIKFTANDGAEIATVNSNSQVDAEGNIVFNYSENATQIGIETSNPISIGTLNIKNTKTIKESSYDRTQKEAFTKIVEKVSGKYDDGASESANVISDGTNEITLKETSSKAILSVSNKALSTTESNSTKIAVRLDTSDESKDLYKNPTIRITLPKQVKAYDITAKLLHGNGLSLNDDSIGKAQDGDNKVITVSLVGEQTKYVTDATGTTLIIEATLDLDNLAISSNEEIKLNYTNENAKTYLDNGEKKVQVNVIAKNPLITSNRINDLNIQTAQEENKDVELARGSEEKKYTYLMDIVNNEANTIKDIRILGKYPVNNSKNNMGITITKQAQAVTQKAVTIYFSTEENVTNDLNDANNKWTQQSEAAKSYMIVINELAVGEKFTFGYEMNVPANLQFNLSAEAGYEVSYKNEAANTQNTTKATTLNFNTGKTAILEQTVKATVGGEEIKDGYTVKSGEIIKYTVTVKNSGNEDATGITFVGSVPEGTNYVEYNNNVEMPDLPSITQTPDTFKEDNNKKEVKYENQTIKAKGEATFEYMVKAQASESKNIVTSFKISNNQGQIKENTFTNRIEPSEMEVNLSKFDSIYNNGRLDAGYEYRYNLKIKNTSNKDKNNIQLSIKSNDLLQIKSIKYNKDDKEIESDKSQITIEKIKANEELAIEVSVIANKPTNASNIAKLSAIVKDSNEEYKSNEIIEEIDAIDVDVKFSAQTTSKSDGYVHKGDKIVYTLNIKNIGETNAEFLELKDEFSDYLVLESITLNNKEVKYDKETIYEDNVKNSIITISAPLNAGESANIVITAKVDDIDYNQLTKIANKATIYNGLKVLDTDEISYLIEKTTNNTPGSQDGNDPNNGGNTSGENGSQNGSNGNNNGQTGNTKTYTIAGTAWKDENENGVRDQGEALISDINVKVLNLESKKFATDNSGKEITAKTNSEGLYALTYVPEGKYIVVFEYDTGKYMPTKYKADGVSNDKNSDAILDNITINNETKQMTITDTIDLTNSIANIDIGLLDAKVFDMQLEKYITKIVVTNSAGTSVHEFKDATLAKADIAAKNLKDSQVVIEYTIKVKNAGEIAGYVRNVVDYKPTSLEFSSTLNKDWYLQGEDLYNASLANTKIEAGETKELKLILTKTMTESNTGLIGNTAEIAEAYNTSGVNDQDSTPGNKAKNEDDMGQADAILGVKTGAAISYIIITLSIVMILGVGAYLVSKKTLNKEIKF